MGGRTIAESSAPQYKCDRYAQVDFANGNVGYGWQVGIGGSGMSGEFGISANQLFFMDTKAGTSQMTLEQGTGNLTVNGHVTGGTGFATYAGTGISGTATYGGCTLTIAGGIITAKSGC